MNIKLEKIIAILILHHNIRLDDAEKVVEGNVNDIIQDIKSGRSVKTISDGLTDIHF